MKTEDGRMLCCMSAKGKYSEGLKKNVVRQMPLEISVVIQALHVKNSNVKKV